MARPREFDTDTAVAQIAEQFWTDGYEATGITDLEEATGLARARLYSAFGPKQDMLYQSIDWYLDTRIEERASMVEAGSLDAIAQWFRDFATVRERIPEMALKGCLLVNTVVELGDNDPGVTARAERYRLRIQGAFASALRNAETAGEIEGDVEAKTYLSYLLLLGLFVTIREGANAQEVKALTEAAAQTVESWRS